MATKRKDGRTVKTFTFQGKKYFAYGNDKREAERKAIEKLQKLEQDKHNHDDPTLNRYFDKWIDEKKDVTKGATIHQ